MVVLQYFNGKEWVKVSTWVNEHLAWVSLGGDDYNYRTIDKNGKVLTDKSGELMRQSKMGSPAPEFDCECDDDECEPDNTPEPNTKCVNCGGYIG